MKKITIRKKITLILFGLFLCTVLLEAGLRIGGFIVLSLQEYKNKLSLKKDGYRILCLGESTTHGGYPEQLSLILNDMDSGKDFSVINKGMGGTNTGIIVTRLESYLERYKPDIVITMMGINDDHFPGGVSPVEDIFKERKDEKIYNVNALRIYKLFKLLKLHINEKLKGTRYEASQNFEDNKPKEEILKKAIETNPMNESGYIELGKFYQAQNRYKEAEEMFKKAIEINPINEREYVKLGECYERQGRFKEAEEMFKKALEINPINELGYVGLAYCYERQNRFKEAEEMFKKALEINPVNERWYFELGQSLHSQMKFEEAEEMLKKAIEINPVNESGYIGLGECYQKQGRFEQNQGRFEEAEEMFKKALEINPEDEYAKHCLLICLQRNRKKDLNIEDKRPSYYLPSTVINYRKLRNILIKRGIVLICVEYAMRDVGELKSIIGEHKNVYFVDNEKSFKEAVEKEGYRTYFTDRYGEEFGHMTIKGKRLLSKNITDVILREYFNK